MTSVFRITVTLVDCVVNAKPVGTKSDLFRHSPIIRLETVIISTQFYSCFFFPKEKQTNNQKKGEKSEEEQPLR